ncbi:CCA tRNA nucleotidyltransferase [Candidatus Saccharibacteria bacterium]|nr:CCA tRNA nucleotidyltransferase [Candidatus Saccharibacteria bacterium]
MESRYFDPTSHQEKHVHPLGLEKHQVPEGHVELQPEWHSAVEVAKILHSSGYSAEIIGGAVRDLLLGLEPKDYDLATNALPEQIEALQGFEKSQFHDTAQAYGVTRVRLDGVEFEVASYRKDVNAHLGRVATSVDHHATLEDDLQRRDFTINAMALDPVTHQLIYNGESLNDLDNKIIRFVGDGRERISEDPLRILRAVRFKNRLGFAYEAQTDSDLLHSIEAGELSSISGERLQQEITAILRTAQSRKDALEDLDRLGIIDVLLPELSAGKDVEQGLEFHAEGDVWVHQLLIMKALPPDASKELIWAALLHDIGKPHRQKLPDQLGERITFYGHDVTSAELARPILNRLKFSNKQKNTILWLIEEHINIAQLPKMKASTQKRMMNHLAFGDLVELHRADGEASWRTLPDGSISKEKPQFQDILALWEYHKLQPPEVQRPNLKRDLGIDGKVIMSLIPNYKNSRDAVKIGQIIRELEERFLNGEVRTHTDALQQAEAIITTL